MTKSKEQLVTIFMKTGEKFCFRVDNSSEFIKSFDKGWWPWERKFIHVGSSNRGCTAALLARDIEVVILLEK